MKPKTIFTLLLVAVGIAAQAQTKTIELPHAAFANSRTLEISKVTLSDTGTVLDVNAFYTPGYWIRVVSDTYLLANGKKYMIRSGEGIELDSLFWMPKSGEAEFKLTFEPLPMNSKTFDFIESDCNDCFKIYGIDLVNKRIQLPEIPAEFRRKHSAETNFQAQLQKGEATVSGKIMSYVPTQEKYSLYYFNPITNIEKNEPVTINADGSFSASITVYSPTQIFLTDRKLFNIPIRVAPGQESKVWVNFPEIYRSGSRLLKDEQSYGNQAYYSGYLAELNTDLTHKDISNPIKGDFRDEIADMDVYRFKDFMIAKYKAAVEQNNKLNIGLLAKKIANYEIAYGLVNYLSMADYVIADAYARKHGVALEEARKIKSIAQFTSDFNDFYQVIPYNDPNVLLVQNIGQSIRSLHYAKENFNDPLVVIRHLSENEKVSTEDRQFFKDYISAQEKGEKFEKASSIGSVFNNYMNLANEFIRTHSGEVFLSKIWNTNDAFLFNLMRSQQQSSELQDFNPLTNEQKAKLAALPVLIQEVILKENDDLLAKIEENKKKTGYTVLNPPANVDEQLFLELMKPFKGKVVLIDVWATWCGPCRAAHAEMNPMKAQFADKDVVFLYLAGEDSPENTWKNMITDIHGSHYRLNQAQWEYLSKSLNVRGVPTYLIVDREGNQTYYTTGFPGVDIMKNELNKALNKKE
jgi:thiol-disulfide isomerase/thioredoxin